MNWNPLESIAAVDQLKKDSYDQPIVIFKHSTHCSISGMALSRLERAWNEQEMQRVNVYFLDLIQHRNVSQHVAESFQIVHQSPQLLLIRDGECVYDTSHVGISYQTLKGQLATA